MQTQQKVAGDDLDVAQVKGFSAMDEVLEEIRRAVGEFELFFLLDLLGDPVDRLGALGFDLGHEGLAHHAHRFLRDEEEHVRRLIHVVDFAHVDRLLQVCQRQGLT